MKEKSKSYLLCETAWEVCWQLGGIYTVLRSKAPAMTERWGDHYCLLGPYNEKTFALEFEAQEITGPFGLAVKRLEEKHGLTAYFGRWLITGRPQVVLIDWLKSFDRLGSCKYFLWKDHHIATKDDQEVNDVILFGFFAAAFFECLAEVVKEQKRDEKIIGHFHEWMAGVPIPLLRKKKLPIALVFTTHATILGRYIAGHDPWFYGRLPHLNPDQEAVRYDSSPRYAIEKAAAHACHCFTTVSDITAEETRHILGRKPDVTVPNGLNIQRFTAIHEFQTLHARYKEQIHEFVRGHFFPSYTFDLDKTLYLFVSGRYEYHNKGLDLFIESLARLNWLLKQHGQGVTVVAFIVTNAAVRGINIDVLTNQTMFHEIRNTCDIISSHIGEKLVDAVLCNKLPGAEEMVDETSRMKLKRLYLAWKRHGNPYVVTHDMVYSDTDPVLNQIRACRLFNGPDDPVKIVFHPQFLSTTSPIIKMDYEQFVRGCHLGVFPSYYEPWGYTPMEAIALGVPAVTSDLSGFGSYVKQTIPQYADKGIYIVDRHRCSFEHSARQLTEIMFSLVKMSRRERVELRNRVESQSTQFDWKILIENYEKAHHLALEDYRIHSRP